MLGIAGDDGGRLGALTRRLHLHEVPALVNVLRGDLSLVGPIPAPPGDGTGPATGAETSARLMRIRPGMTGLWRLLAREQLSAEEALSMDLRYVDNWSVTLDVVILCRTLRAFVAGNLVADLASTVPRQRQVDEVRSAPGDPAPLRGSGDRARRRDLSDARP